MAYVKSGQIRVFPSVGRSNYDIESQLMNENNISQIVRSLCRERKDYVLSKELGSGPFEFVIYGFYFKILQPSSTLSSIISGENVTEVWAGIKIDANAEANNASSNYQLLQLANTSAQNNEIVNLDVKDEFQGIIFGSTEGQVKVEGQNYHTLLLLKKDGETFKTPAQSLLHVNTTEILDGGSSDYISDKFTTKNLIVSQSISDDGTLTVSGDTTLSALTASNTEITGTLNVTGDTTLSSVTASFISAITFSGKLTGNADTASNFNDDRTFTFSGGDISGSATSSTGGYTISATLVNSCVTTAKIKDANVTTDKIAQSAVTNNEIADNTIKVEKLAFKLNMTLSVDGKDENHKTLTISFPTLDNK